MGQCANLTFGLRILNHLEASCLPHISNYISHVTNSFRQLQLLPFWLCITMLGSFVKLDISSFCAKSQTKISGLYCKRTSDILEPKRFKPAQRSAHALFNTLKRRSGACYLSTSSFRNGAKNQKGIDVIHCHPCTRSLVFFPVFQGRGRPESFWKNDTPKSFINGSWGGGRKRPASNDGSFRSFAGSETMFWSEAQQRDLYPYAKPSLPDFLFAVPGGFFYKPEVTWPIFRCCTQAAKVSHVFFRPNRGFCWIPPKKRK